MFWLENPTATLLDPSKFGDFLPVMGADAKTADLDEQLNSIMRLSIYFAVLMLMMGRASAAVFAIVLAAAFTYALRGVPLSNSENYEAGDANKSDKANNCRKPTLENPFMNPLPFDRRDAPGACDIEDQNVRRSMYQLFNENLYRDVSDVFHRQASDRQYYTVPVTTFPNDQTEFAKWLYDRGPTCKENQLQCGTKGRYG